MLEQRKITLSKLFIHCIFILLSASFIIPILTIVSISISNEASMYQHGFKIIPEQLDFSAYKYLFGAPKQIISAYKVTAISSVAGVLIYLVMASMCAYALARQDFKFRKVITFYLFLTMLFNGGLVPTYILMTSYLKLQNTYAALIIPLLSNVWYVMLMRTFFQDIPSSIVESANIDGASELTVYFRIILPLSKPVLATVGMLQLLAFWNSWFPALLYISKSNMYPLQYMLQTMLRNIQEAMRDMNNMQSIAADLSKLPSESLRMAMAIVAIGPMAMIFPFFQKYFTRGLTVGSVKG